MTDAATVQPKVQTGELVQLRQYEGISQEQRNETLQKTGREHDPVHWIYATVMDTLPDGRIRLRVDHPGNRWHGEERIVSPENVRTEADVDALAASAEEIAEKKQTQQARELAKHFRAQHARLAETNKPLRETKATEEETAA